MAASTNVEQMVKYVNNKKYKIGDTFDLYSKYVAFNKNAICVSQCYGGVIYIDLLHSKYCRIVKPCENYINVSLSDTHIIIIIYPLSDNGGKDDKSENKEYENKESVGGESDKELAADIVNKTIKVFAFDLKKIKILITPIDNISKHFKGMNNSPRALIIDDKITWTEIILPDRITDNINIYNMLFVSNIFKNNNILIVSNNHKIIYNFVLNEYYYVDDTSKVAPNIDDLSIGTRARCVNSSSVFDDKYVLDPVCNVIFCHLQDISCKSSIMKMSESGDSENKSISIVKNIKEFKFGCKISYFKHITKFNKIACVFKNELFIANLDEVVNADLPSHLEELPPFWNKIDVPFKDPSREFIINILFKEWVFYVQTYKYIYVAGITGTYADEKYISKNVDEWTIANITLAESNIRYKINKLIDRTIPEGGTSQDTGNADSEFIKYDNDLPIVWSGLYNSVDINSDSVYAVSIDFRIFLVYWDDSINNMIARQIYTGGICVFIDLILYFNYLPTMLFNKCYQILLENEEEIMQDIIKRNKLLADMKSQEKPSDAESNDAESN